MAWRMASIVCSTFSRISLILAPVYARPETEQLGLRRCSRGNWRRRPWPGNLRGMGLAHQGGGDEMLFLALPLGLFAFLLFIANRKAQAQLEDDELDDESESDIRE